MLTKKYKNGIITLDAEAFPSVAQETIDREIKNFEPARVAVEKLYEYEQKDIPQDVVLVGEEYCCPNCGNDTSILSDDKYCVECGQALDWSDVE